MKLTKVFSIIALSAMTLVANAVNKAQINIVGENGAAEATLNVAQKTGTSVEFLMVTDGEAINVWAVKNSTKYSTLYTTDELIGTPLGFKGNSNTNYTMSFKYVDGTVKLYDAVENVEVTLANGETYAFTCEANTEIANRFFLGKIAPAADYSRANLTVGNWYTICLPEASVSFSGMDLYKVAGYSAQKGLGVDPVEGQMEAGMPYIFQATATEISVFYVEEGEVKEEPVAGANYLTGTFEEMTTSAVAYVVANNMLNWAAVGTTVPANRAYLNYPDITDGNFPTANPIYPAPGRKFLPAPKAMPTELNEVPAGMADGTYMINGQVVLVKDGKMFNVLGL